MFHFLRYKTLFLRFNSIHAIRIQSFRNPSRKRLYKENPPTSLIEYLQSSLGFSSERALALSQNVKGRNAMNPDSVHTFFKSLGLSESRIKSIINRAPRLLCYSYPESSFRPKIQFFKEKGFSESDVADLFFSNPYLLTHSIEGNLRPVFNLLSSMLGTDEFVVQFLIRSKLIFQPDILSTNITILKNCGVQNRHISKLIIKRPRGLLIKSNRFDEVVEMVKGMGFKPQTNLFVNAVVASVGLSRQSWNAKFKVYTSLGCSTEEIQQLFRKQPWCMSLSEDKIRKGVDYLTKEFGWGPSQISINPTLLCLSLEKRIIPRHRFLQFLASKGFINKGFINKDKAYARSFMISEKNFLKNFVIKYESVVPDVLKIYEGLVGSKLLNIKDREGCEA